MTRRTDWAEYADPVPPEGRGHGGDGDPVGDGGRAHDGGYGSDGFLDGFLDGDPDGPDGVGRRNRGSRGRAGLGDPGGPEGYGDGPADAYGSPADGAGRGGTGRRGGGGPRGARGRRRNGGFGEPSGDAQDGGTPTSSRAERGEPSGDPAERARAICLRLLTGTPRTRKQLADALRKREIPDEVADEVLSRFEEVGLINDGAFADAWVESRHHGRGLARRALARELRTKGVDSTLIDEAVGQLDSEQEETTARELVARKLRSTRGLDRDKRLRRLAGMLARKGYSEGMALRVVRQALEEEGEDTEGLGDEGF
ncbi:recombination regulator RecX [Streptomyces sp. NPDC056785]|uniref:recombination regulator RecX n=1 Tax=Streptomyces sp. NPDC056785 TaxID=3345944 RepID=UPI00368BCE94